jgi:hypothetical protein
VARHIWVKTGVACVVLLVVIIVVWYGRWDHAGRTVQAVVRDVDKATKLGEMREQLLRSTEGDETELLDLDTGLRAKVRNVSAAPASVESVRSQQLDVFAVNNRRSQGLVCYDMAVMKVASTTWGSVTPEQLWQYGRELQQQELKIRGVITTAEELRAGFPTYVFRTREGGRGILQVVALVEEPAGARIRYRLSGDSSDLGAGTGRMR